MGYAAGPGTLRIICLQLHIVDVHVALAAAERGHAILTSDDADIAAVGPGLVLVHV